MYITSLLTSPHIECRIDLIALDQLNAYLYKTNMCETDILCFLVYGSKVIPVYFSLYQTSPFHISSYDYKSCVYDDTEYEQTHKFA